MNHSDETVLNNKDQVIAIFYFLLAQASKTIPALKLTEVSVKFLFHSSKWQKEVSKWFRQFLILRGSLY